MTLAREVKPVAITLDIMLPGVDGWEVLRRLKSDEATCDVPVVIVSRSISAISRSRWAPRTIS